MAMGENPPHQRSAGSGSFDDDRIAYLDHVQWRRLSDAETDEEFCSAWLVLQCRIIGGVHSGVVVLGSPETGQFTPVASWPKRSSDFKNLAEVIERAVKERKGILIKNEAEGEAFSAEGARYNLAYPVRVGGKLHGVAALEITYRSQDKIESVMRQLQWGVAWLENWIHRKESAHVNLIKDRITTALDLAAVALQEDHFKAAATSFVTVLATRLSCDRVSIGFLKGKHVKVIALSHSAHFKKQTNLIQSIGAAMDESLEQQKILCHPKGDDKEISMMRVHTELAKEFGSAAVCTIPFINEQGKGYGAMTLERSQDHLFDSKTVELCDSVASLVAPILDQKRKNDEILIKKILKSTQTQVKKIIGPGHIAAKLIVASLIMLAIFFTFAKADYRVTAKTSIEGKIQRAIVAPYDGFIFEADVRAGDTVEEGQVLCSLDDRDLHLQRLNLISQRDQQLREYRDAMGKWDRANMKVLRERINQAEAKLALVDEQLARAKMIAPFAGVIVSGDLSQSLNAPVQRGQVLFEVAPLNAYRVILQVDERDIEEIKTGQKGDLLLNALPQVHFPLIVEKTTPVSINEEGVNYFRVESRLEEASVQLRPGMEGYGKIYIDRRRLIWIWTHDLIDWIRLWVWSWWP